MRSSRSLIATAALLALVCMAGAAGCRTMGRPAAEGPPAIDACANRLHELSGRLLLYFAGHECLPPSVDALRAAAAGGDDAVPLTCPATDKAYLYFPEGRAVAGRPWRIIVCDAVPHPGGGRWAAAADKLESGAPLVLRIIWLPEAEAAAAVTSPAR